MRTMHTESFSHNGQSYEVRLLWNEREDRMEAHILRNGVQHNIGAVTMGKEAFNDLQEAHGNAIETMVELAKQKITG